MQNKLSKSFTRFSAILLVLPFLTLFSCATTAFDKESTLTGVVSDKKGQPISGYKLSFGLGNDTITGVNGMFVLPDMKLGKYKMTGFKKGYTPVDEKIDFFDKRSVLVVQVDEISDSYDELVSFIRDDDFESAQHIIEKIKCGNEKNITFKFYETLLSYCTAKKTYFETNAESDFQKVEIAKANLDEVIQNASKNNSKCEYEDIKK